MTLTDDAVEDFTSVLEICKPLAISKLIIEPGLIRGVDEKLSMALLSDHRVPDFQGNSITLNRVNALSARLALLKAQGSLSVAASLGNQSTEIISLELKAGKSKTAFRCTLQQHVKVIKTINDEMHWDVTISGTSFAFLQQAIAAMGTDSFSLVSKDGVSIAAEAVDASRDVFVAELGDGLSYIGPDNGDQIFCHKYQAKSILVLLREHAKTAAETLNFQIGENGVLSSTVQGHKCYIMPAAL